ncbi:MAG: choice-of-anchor tandem repeat GloVer-containing protein [Verrucomicrobiota bacterium]
MSTQTPRFVAAIFFAWFALTGAGLSQSSLQTIHGQRPPGMGQLKPLARPAPSTNLNLVVGLPLRHPEALASLLHHLYDPASPRFHQYLTPGQFAERFGPSEQDYQEVIHFAAARGLTVTGAHANRTLLDVTGSVADIERVFHVRMGVYQHPTEARTFYAPDADPSVDLAVPILAVNGLDDFVLPRPMNLHVAFGSTNGPSYVSGSGPGGYFLGNDLRAAYAPGVALNGAGQAVGLFELDGYYASDIAEYESLAKLPNVTLTNVLLDGFNGVPGQNNIEVALDIDMAISMAPGLAEVIVYEGSTPDDILNRMATDNRARQLSCSWGFGPQTDAAREQIFAQFAAQGQTMFQASGDSGAYAGAVYPPSDDTNVTVVGGTLLTTSGPGGPWLAETVWPESGGGFSSTFALPTWQQGLGTPANQGSTSFRNIPDVAALAGVSIWLVAFNGEQGPIGGTSAATPLWAGFAALANQQAAARGQPPIGFLNPALYAIGRSAGYAAAFHDITAGNNTNGVSPSNFFAVPGYDLCTGWGTPAGSNLINALLTAPDALQVFPATALTAGGGKGGPFNPAAQNMVLTNIGAASLSWTAANTTAWLDVAPGGGTLTPGGAGAVVTLSLNSAAGNLPPASYAATVWFTNLNDGVAQSRRLILNVAPASSVPLILSQPLSQTAPPGASAVFTVTAVGNAPLSYQWQEDTTNLSDGGNISGSTTAVLTIDNVSSAAAGTYSVIVSNSLGWVSSTGAVLAVASVTAPGVTFSTLYSFTGGADGGNPNGLMQETNGNFYGTTQSGGIEGSGTVFQMTPSGVVTTLFLFSNAGSGGYSPVAGLAQGVDGNLYGTTENGGSNGWGTVFKTTTNGNLTTVVTFTSGNGAEPDETMIVGADGNFYGTTFVGGASGEGEVFRMTPNGALSVLASFNGLNGFNPSELAQGADGSLYGTTLEGGTYGDGTIFKVTTNGTLTSLFSFSYTNGGFLPFAGLTQVADGSFYGTTYEGGAFSYGTVFSMSPSGGVTTLYSFTGGNDGGHPAAELILAADGNFYGTTFAGGAYDDGTIFRMAPGYAPVTLVSFDGDDGANPQTPLVLGADGNLYGTTQNGGAGGNGVIFRVNINSPSVQITGQPAGQSAFLGGNAVFSVAVAGNPPLFYQWRKNGADLADGGNLSGSMTRVLTVSNVGVSDAAIYSVAVSNAAGSALTSDGAFLEVLVSPPQIITPPASQTAAVGGAAVFNVAAVGDLPLAYQWQSNQINLANGATVSGATTSSLTLSGLTQRSDATYSVIVSNAAGAVSAAATLAVFPVSAPGTRVASLYWFTGGNDGGFPNGLTLGANGVLYGTTQGGGAYHDGTVFSVTTNGAFTTLVSFNLTNGSSPGAALAPGADGNFYGVTASGGMNSGGTVFQMTPDGALTTLALFTNEASVNPYTALAQGANGNFYGATENAYTSGDGNIFEMTPSGTPGIVYSFTGGLDGNAPVGALVQGADGNFYGMTAGGGAHGHGGVFKMTPAGALTNFYSFTGGADGYNPAGALVQGTDGNFYGVTKRNVISGFAFYGTIFKVSTNGALTTLYALNPSVYGDGAYPFAGLIQGADGNSYGTTYLGGAAGNGTVFRITSAGAFATLVSFNGSDDGAQPEAALAQDAEGNFYGTTTSGGPYGKGSIFRLSITSAPQITTQPANQTAFAGASVVFSVAVFGASPLSYQWQENGNNLTDGGNVSGSTSRILTLSDITANNAGSYSVIVSNALGAVTSTNATLVVETPPVFQSAAQAGGALTLTWSASPGQSYQVQSTTNLASPNWISVGGALTATNSSMSASYGIGSNSQQFYRILLLP